MGGGGGGGIFPLTSYLGKWHSTTRLTTKGAISKPSSDILVMNWDTLFTQIYLQYLWDYLLVVKLFLNQSIKDSHFCCIHHNPSLTGPLPLSSTRCWNVPGMNCWPRSKRPRTLTTSLLPTRCSSTLCWDVACWMTSLGSVPSSYDIVAHDVWVVKKNINQSKPCPLFVSSWVQRFDCGWA